MKITLGQKVTLPFASSVEEYEVTKIWTENGEPWFLLKSEKYGERLQNENQLLDGIKRTESYEILTEIEI
jgi:hypothetical protein